MLPLRAEFKYIYYKPYTKLVNIPEKKYAYNIFISVFAQRKLDVHSRVM